MISFECPYHQKITEKIEQHHKEVTAKIEQLVLEYRFELSGPVWKTRILEYQQKAMKKPYFYVEPKLDDQYFPTSEGKKLLLQTDLQKDIIEILQKNSSMKNNRLLLTLGIFNLLKKAQDFNLQKKAQERPLELDVLLGVIASFADEIKDGILKSNCKEV